MKSTIKAIVTGHTHGLGAALQSTELNRATHQHGF